MLELLNRHHITGSRRHLDLPGKLDCAFRNGFSGFCGRLFLTRLPPLLQGAEKERLILENQDFGKHQAGQTGVPQPQEHGMVRDPGYRVSLRKNPEREARRIQMKLG